MENPSFSMAFILDKMCHVFSFSYMKKCSKRHGKPQFSIGICPWKMCRDISFKCMKKRSKLMEKPSFSMAFTLDKCVKIFHFHAWNCLFSELDSHNKSLWLKNKSKKTFNLKDCAIVMTVIQLPNELRLPLEKYHKVMSYNTFCLEAHAGIFRLLMKGIFDPYVLSSSDKKWIS